MASQQEANSCDVLSNRWLHCNIKLSHTSYMVSNALVSYVLWGRACWGESESFGSLSMLPLACLALAWPKTSCSSHLHLLFNVWFFPFFSSTILVVSSLSCLVSPRSGTVSVTTFFPGDGHPSLFLCTHAPLQAEGWASAHYYVSSGEHLPLPQALGPGSLRVAAVTLQCLRRLYFLLGVVRKELSPPPSPPVVSCVLTEISLKRLSFKSASWLFWAVPRQSSERLCQHWQCMAALQRLLMLTGQSMFLNNPMRWISLKAWELKDPALKQNTSELPSPFLPICSHPSH